MKTTIRDLRANARNTVRILRQAAPRDAITKRAIATAIWWLTEEAELTETTKRALAARQANQPAGEQK